MNRIVVALLVLPLVTAAGGRAHEPDHQRARLPVVVDTDLGLDDAVALAVALQRPDLALVAVVATEGAAGPVTGVELLERLVHRFNRTDVPVYAPATRAPRLAPPPFRAFAERAVGAALATPAPRLRLPFAAEAYVSDQGATVVLALGPLTNLAAALARDPTVAGRIDRVVVAGEPDAERNWNLSFDREALAAVRRAGLRLDFVVNDAARKPAAWVEDGILAERTTTVGAAFLADLFGDPTVRRHYVEGLPRFTDELVPMQLVDPSSFRRRATDGALVAAAGESVASRLVRLVHTGRHRRERVVFADRPLPDDALRPDIAARRRRLVAAHGPDEWFAQLLMNEMHEHLGAYSVIGVKMGLRGAEILNAPRHGMHVTARTSPRPPVRCLIDGLIVATGCSPGRALFTHEPSPTGRVEAVFVANGRRLTLRLRDEYHARVRDHIAHLLAEHTLEDDAYWAGVREFGLKIWERWHRVDLFETVALEDEPLDAAGAGRSGP